MFVFDNFFLSACVYTFLYIHKQGFEAHGRDFALIQRDFLPHKDASKVCILSSLSLSRPIYHEMMMMTMILFPHE